MNAFQSRAYLLQAVISAERTHTRAVNDFINCARNLADGLSKAAEQAEQTGRAYAPQSSESLKLIEAATVASYLRDHIPSLREAANLRPDESARDAYRAILPEDLRNTPPAAPGA